MHQWPQNCLDDLVDDFRVSEQNLDVSPPFGDGGTTAPTNSGEDSAAREGGYDDGHREGIATPK